MPTTMNTNLEKYAKTRLFKDWKELEQSKEFLSTVSALPTSDIFVWHCNLRPDYGPYTGTIFHLILRFPRSYPRDPPDVELCTWLSHPNVWDWRAQGYSLCLDMIQRYYTSTPYTGWTSAYSILSLLLQLQSFLFAENIPQDYGGLAKSITAKTKVGRCTREARAFVCYDIETHDGEKVKHTHDKPWPPLPQQRATGPVDKRQHDWRPPAGAPSGHLPSEVYAKIFSYLDPKGLIQARDVCVDWNQIVMTYNLFERSQIMCFHTKAKVDDPDTILGIGLKVEYYPDGKTLKLASSPLDVLSEHAFDRQNVRTGVWGGKSEAFDYFLPLVLHSGHAAKAVDRMETTIHTIMKHCELPSLEENAPLRRRQGRQRGPRSTHHKDNQSKAIEVCHTRFHPLMAFQLLAVLMNSMVVELMNAAKGEGVSRFASEKALEGFCAFHHLLLFFAERYPLLNEYAEKQVQRFLSGYFYRHKRQVPNLGVLLICLTLSKTGWESLRKPLVMEAFDRNVRWLLQKHPKLARDDVSPADRLQWTFNGARTSLRLLMFQTYFMSRIGRPKGMAGPRQVLEQYNKQMGKPTPQQKNDLQRNAKEILALTTWPRFFQRLGGAVPPAPRLVTILKEAVAKSGRKKYHDPDRARKLREDQERRERRLVEAARELAEREARIGEFWDRREHIARERRQAEEERQSRIVAERADLAEGEFTFFDQVLAEIGDDM